LFQVPARHHHAHFFGHKIRLALAANPSRVHEPVRALSVPHYRIHGIARRPGNIRNNGPIHAREAIEHGRFPDVRPPDDRHVDLLVLFLGGRRFFLLRPGSAEPRRYRFKQRVKSIAVLRRHGKHIVRKPVKWRGERFLHLRVYFVGKDRQRLPCAPQEARQLTIQRR
jgi:hypothetical protein